jgi:hypothetical protein
MRRLVSYFGITLLALFVSGWNVVLAAAFCPHAGAQQTVLPKAEEASCHSESGQAKEQQTNSHTGSNEASHDMKAQPIAALRIPGDNRQTAAQSFRAGTCAHCCIGRNESPATPASAQEITLQRRDTGSVAQQATALLSLTVAFTAQFTPTQHAPPGLSNRRHILFSVFLI